MPNVSHSKIAGWPRLFVVLGTAVAVVLVISSLTNYLGPKWDTEFYLDMATNGIVHNKHLAAPFAYRPAAPFLIGGMARALKLQPESVFRDCGAVMSVVFVLASYLFARSTGASFGAAWFSSLLAALYFFVVKWTVFSGAMVDIYAYPLILLAFWALCEKDSTFVWRCARSVCSSKNFCCSRSPRKRQRSGGRTDGALRLLQNH